MKVIYGFLQMEKIHAKMSFARCREEGTSCSHVQFGTGNLYRNTAIVYTDVTRNNLVNIVIARLNLRTVLFERVEIFVD
jgi:polyphosphate kinase